MMIKDQVNELFEQQLSVWEMARNNFEGLKTVQIREFDFDGFGVKVQFNPARMVSSGAKVDAKTIAQRKCFLCAANRPEVQRGIEWRDYDILINPFPIFTRHLTIPRREHVDQRLVPYISDMFDLARELPDFVVFYNGPKCGASAPDHMHFQAGNADFLPLVSDYFNLKAKGKCTKHNAKFTTEGVDVYTIDNYLRVVYCIESSGPATESPAPAKMAVRACGNLDLTIMFPQISFEHPPPRIMLNTSEAGIRTVPNSRLRNANATIETNIAAKRRVVCLFIISPEVYRMFPCNLLQQEWDGISSQDP